MDEEIADVLKRSGVPLLVAVNKVDNDDREDGLYDFYRLGVGDPVAISALGGRSIGDFLDRLIAHIPNQDKKAEDESAVHVAVVGRPNVGKSSFVNTILGEEKLIVTDIAGTTRDAIDTGFKYKDNQLVLIDTAGLRKKAKVSQNVEYFSNVRSIHAMQRCDVAVVLIDAGDGLTDQDKKIIMTAVDLGKGIVLGVNKWDLVKKDTHTARRMETGMKEQLRDLNYIPVLFISSLKRQRIFNVLDTALSVYEERQKRISTPILNTFLKNVVNEHHPPAYGTKWVKLNYMTQIRSRPPLFAFFANEPKGIKANYRNYLENKIREQFGFLGVPIRMTFRKKNK